MPDFTTYLSNLIAAAPLALVAALLYFGYRVAVGFIAIFTAPRDKRSKRAMEVLELITTRRKPPPPPQL